MDATIALIEHDPPPEGRGRFVCQAGYELALSRFGDRCVRTVDGIVTLFPQNTPETLP